MLQISLMAGTRGIGLLSGRLGRSLSHSVRLCPTYLPSTLSPPLRQELRCHTLRRARRQYSTKARARVELPVDRPTVVRVTFPNGQQSDFHHIWLRDHCREACSYHPETRQRLVDSASIPVDLRPSEVETTPSGIKVTWPPHATTPSYTSFFPLSFLLESSYEPPLQTEPVKKFEKTFWTAAIATSLPTVQHDEVMSSEQGVYEWVRCIADFGFCFVKGVPPTPEATEALIRRIAFIRETHYGGFWDFTADLKHGDLAYSNYELRSHTDTTYFTDPCGLQLFHLLSPASSHKGGENLLVDGFRAATVFKELHPRLYELFSTLPVPSHASGTGSSSLPSGVHMAPLVPSPVFNHSPTGELVQVRWNCDDRAPIGGLGWEGKMMEWYEALREWEKILRSDEATLWTKMEAGTAIIFDNHRVLHGRSTFTGERRLCGAYVSGDDYRSRLEGLTRQFGQCHSAGSNDTMEAFGVKRAVNSGVWKGY